MVGLNAGAVYCPACDWPMTRQDKMMCCKNPSCDMGYCWYHVPMVEVVPVKEREILEAINPGEAELEPRPSECLAKILRDLADTIDRRGVARFSATDMLGRSSHHYGRKPGQTFTVKWDWEK